MAFFLSFQRSSFSRSDICVYTAHVSGVQCRQQSPEPCDSGVQFQLVTGTYNRHQWEVGSLQLSVVFAKSFIFVGFKFCSLHLQYYLHVHGSVYMYTTCILLVCFLCMTFVFKVYLNHKTIKQWDLVPNENIKMRSQYIW